MARITKLYQLLENSAAQFPDQLALVHGELRITFKDLNATAETIATQLKRLVVTKGNRVAISSPKSITAVASLFGILKADAAYVPVDFSSPIERNKFIVRDCEVSALILTKELFQHFKEEFSFVAELGENLVLAKNNTVDLKPSPNDLAYVLYTSGSTGRPKGVMVAHEGALEFINWSSDVFKPNASDRFSSHAPFHFDLSIFDLYVSVKHGATLVLIKEDVAKQPLLLAQLIADEKITCWYSTPSSLMMLAEYGKMEKYNYSNLRTVLFAGEVFPLPKFKLLKTKIPFANYFNLYGPTETNVCTYYPVPEKIETVMPIGKVCEHYLAKVVDDELLISGKGVMLGYWNVPKDNFYVDEHKGIWYKTGDLVEEKNGEFIFKGRRDRMVKRNGYRIELDEIETGLNKHEGIALAAVVGSINSEEQMEITAFVVMKNGKEKSTIKMKEYCMNHLPSYMLPNNIRFVDDLPYTSSNKVDYQKLIGST